MTGWTRFSCRRRWSTSTLPWRRETRCRRHLGCHWGKWFSRQKATSSLSARRACGAARCSTWPHGALGTPLLPRGACERCRLAHRARATSGRTSIQASRSGRSSRARHSRPSSAWPCSTAVRPSIFLTASYHMQSLSLSPSKCRPQEVILELRVGTDATGGEVLLEITGMASSFGPAFPSLPPSLAQGEGELRAPPVSAGEAAEAAAARAPPAAGTRTVHICGDVGDSALEARNDNDSVAVGSCQASPDSAEVRLRPPQTPLRWPPPPRLQELALPRLELDAAPGRLSPFTEGGARHLALRRLLATRPAVFAEPLDGCSALRVPAGAPFEDPKSYYEGRVVFVTRGSCLFLQKVHLLQRVWVAAAVVINHEGGENNELQVMTCPLQEKGAGNDIHIPALMISSEDGARALDWLRRGQVGTVPPVSAIIYSAH
mmetsp:Transcript_56556/g.183863  ORF Transcript_56556/g.183863 Transcript_56556/m.183863 type:complete len:432 (+) Transcript_56556:1531-2826(+)